jgi:hypothetical protein
MEDMRFDSLSQYLAVEGSRRRILGGIVAAAASVVTGATALGVKGKAKGKSKDKGKGQGHGAAGAPGKNKVGLCHLDDETGLFSYLEVPPPAMKGHLKHGDQPALGGAADCDALNGSEPEPEPEV